MISLSFRPLQNGSAAIVRGAYFRICADGTLRGPDNDIAARYVDGIWHLGHSRHASFECAGPVYLRVTNLRGQRVCLGPYPFIKAAEGAVFTENSCLGVHAARKDSAPSPIELWHEVSLLTSI